MKKFQFFTFLLVIVPLISSAQNISSQKREVGISLSAPNSFGIRYRSGNEKMLIRLTLLSLNGSSSSNKYDSNQSYTNSSGGIGLNFGFEKRKPITNNLGFYIGSDLLMSYSKNTFKNPQTSYSETHRTVSPGIGLVLGFIYKISDDINISAEVVPSIVYSYTQSIILNGVDKSTQTGRGFSYGFTNSVGNLTLSFILGKKN